ncbi:hypothetical protein BDZ45DRAFT_643016 [Acephala macrosclerotiorum]|nr:hypothetical protein BDZ45DRAFT_643016 [Acephala macrosclerotiorum]
MSYEIPEEEVAQDFAAALADLSMNSRYEISNLTVIARENTASALAISEALKAHIKQTSPAKKLPAFYVLDSIIKNVGTPYTLFFGRQLYSTFMEAYALVDNNVRSKMVEMLKTWKEPVPGSMDTRPVFPPEVTRPIENALIKARTSFLQAHQEQTRSQQNVIGRGRQMQSSTPYRETPTPPGSYRPPTQPTPGYASNYPPQQYPVPINGQQYPPQGPPPQQYPTQQIPPNGQQYPSQQNSYQPHGLPPRPPSQQYSQPPPNAAGWQQQYPNQPQPPYQAQSPVMGYTSTEDSLAALNSDIENLINESKAEWSRNPHEVSFQTKLKALFDLQTILRSQKLPPDQISLIQNQVAQLKKAPQSAPIMQTPQAPLPPTPVVAPPAPAQQQPTLSSILGPGALAALLARQSATPQPSSAVPDSIRSPQQASILPYQPPPSVTPAATPIPDPNSLLGRLRAAGMLPGLGATTSAPTPTVSTPTLPSPPFMNTPPTSTRTPLGIIPNDVVLKPASLKIPRPHLLAGLYEHLGAPCTQCGRRFQSDEEGKKKKAAHMDWHFHVRQRMDEAESRGQHRSWYVDELDWIKSREVEGESSATTTDPSQNTTAATAAKNSKQQYIPAPDDPTLASVPCPICQEKFEMKWLDDAQEFVWMDAMKVGEKIYHASCFTEATKDVNTQAKRGTPEPVLGKRKAEDDGFAFRAKIKSEA